MILPDKLPDLSFCETSTESVEKSVIDSYEAISGRRLFKGDPIRLFLEGIASVITQQRMIIDFSAKQNLLSYSSGDYLDHLGVLTGVARMSASYAATSLRFEISAPRADVVSIPSGTRATSGGDLLFSTVETVEIPPGDISVEVRAVCNVEGTRGNGFLPGQISKLVDPLPFVVSVSNVAESSGGIDRENDDNLRLRISEAPGSFSVAGPSESYRFWARSAHQGIVDVSVISPTPGVVEVYPLMADGQIPDENILSLVDSVVNDLSIRPLTDLVKVLSPESVEYGIEVRYWIAQRNAVAAGSIQRNVEEAVREYILWQKSSLGRDINPSELTARIMAAGAKRVELASPVFTSLSVSQVARDISSSLAYGGLEDG